MTRYRCHACAATFAARSPAERHADDEHHHRLELILDDEGSRMGQKNDNNRIRAKRRRGEKHMGPPRPNTVTANPPATGKQLNR